VRALSVFLLATVVLMAMGCEGEQGPTGPSGDDGNANVTTGTVTPTSADWLWNSIYWFSNQPDMGIGYISRYFDIPLEQLTAEFLATGVVLVYFEAYTGSGNWTPLPFQFVDGSQTHITNIVYEVSESRIRLHYFNMANVAGATFPDLQNFTIATYTFKYTLIEGSALEGMTSRGIVLSDYDEVMGYLGEH